MNPTESQFSRTEMLLGSEAVEKLRRSRVAVFGIGGVGGYAVEALVRSGIGAIDLFDNDTVSLSNLNRQLFALHSTLGRLKVDVAEERIHDINPDCRVGKHALFYLPEVADEIDLSPYDFVIDCVDTLAAKLELARRCHLGGIRLISSMGAANKMDPAQFQVADIFSTDIDPLAKVLRKKLRKMGIPRLLTVCSKEPPMQPRIVVMNERKHRPTPASNAFVPAAAGLILAGEVVRQITGVQPL